MKSLTLSEVANALAVYRGTVFIHIGHKELSKMPDNRPADAVVRYPLNNGFGLDVAQLLQRDFLQPVSERKTRLNLDALTSSTPSRSSRSLRSSYCLLVRFFILLTPSPSMSTSSSSSSLCKNSGIRLLFAARDPRLPPRRSLLSLCAILASAARRAAGAISSKSFWSSKSASEYRSSSSFAA